jgi:hypothetical protein
MFKERTVACKDVGATQRNLRQNMVKPAKLQEGSLERRHTKVRTEEHLTTNAFQKSLLPAGSSVDGRGSIG